MDRIVNTFSRAADSDSLPAAGRPFERGQPRLWRGQAAGRGSFGTFLAAKKSTQKSRKGKLT